MESKTRQRLKSVYGMWLCESREASVRPAGPAPRMAIRGFGVFVLGAIIYHGLYRFSLICW